MSCDEPSPTTHSLMLVPIGLDSEPAVHSLSKDTANLLQSFAPHPGQETALFNCGAEYQTRARQLALSHWLLNAAQILTASFPHRLIPK
jgi:hypothetical protein